MINKMTLEDMQAMAEFHKIVKNYIKINNLLEQLKNDKR